MIRSKKIKASARNEDCTLRLVGICNYNDETTVLAHIGRNRGMAIKCDDTFAVYACSACHSAIDGAERSGLALDLLRALEETQKILFNKGLLNAK